MQEVFDVELPEKGKVITYIPEDEEGLIFIEIELNEKDYNDIIDSLNSAEYKNTRPSYLVMGNCNDGVFKILSAVVPENH